MNAKTLVMVCVSIMFLLIVIGVVFALFDNSHSADDWNEN